MNLQRPRTTWGRQGSPLTGIVTLLSILVLSAVLLPPAPGAGAAQEGDAGLDGANPKQVEESTTGSYVVIMATDPLVADYDRHDLNTVRARADRERIRAGHRRVMRDARVAEGARVSDLTNVVNGFTVVASHDEAVALAAQPGVARVVPDVERYLTTDSSPDFLGLDGRGEAWGRGIDGRGVVVGVIDSGIWPEHPSFADDGSYTYPAGVNPDIPCEFGNTDHNPADVAFECNNKLLGARQVMATYEAVIGIEDVEFDSARDHHGHGSHTASTAAGNRGVPAEVLGRDLGTVSGIAPRAHIIAYKTAGGDFGLSFSSDLAVAIDAAVADGVDVINYSIGSGNLTGVESIAFLFATDAGVFIAASAGNEGNGPGAVGGTMPWLTTVAASTQRRFFPGRIVLGSGETYLGASLTQGVGNSPLVDSADAGSEDCTAGPLDPDVVGGAIVLCRRGIGCRCEWSQAVLEAGGVGIIIYDTTDEGNLSTDSHSVPGVHVDHTPGLAIKEYIATAADPTARLVVQNTTTSWPSAPSIARFSSRGPNLEAPDIIKPDITAPGVQILAAHSPYAGAGEMFQAIQGTSMSAPHIAGVYALLKQRHPEWSPAAARSALMTTARHDVVDNDRVTPAGPFATGSGHVDPGIPSIPGSMFQPGLVYDAGFNDYLGFLCTEGPEVFTDPVATCAELESLGFPTDPSNLNYPSIGIAELVDTETVARTVTNLGRRATYRVSIDAPAGFDVEVTPSSFTVDPGDSVTYEVTVTNDGTGNPGEWSTGSLTWTAGRYEVYSPIAINTLLFDAPTEVVGSGTDGSASFEVRFGYTGEYSATAYGLGTATVISDTVVQDPDQGFDPDDGYSTVHEFDLEAETAVFHLAIPPEAADPGTDLDVYVVDPAGFFRGASFNAGTDEEVTIFDLMPGVWTVYVHGWDTVDGEAAYDLSTWIVPATSGGSLTIDSAPDSAQTGETGTVELSWAGAEQGLNVGVVRHADADGPLGYTLVEVDNP